MSDWELAAYFSAPWAIAAFIGARSDKRTWAQSFLSAAVTMLMFMGMHSCAFHFSSSDAPAECERYPGPFGC